MYLLSVSQLERFNLSFSVLVYEISGAVAWCMNEHSLQAEFLIYWWSFIWNIRYNHSRVDQNKSWSRKTGKLMGFLWRLLGLTPSYHRGHLHRYSPFDFGDDAIRERKKYFSQRVLNFHDFNNSPTPKAPPTVLNRIARITTANASTLSFSTRMGLASSATISAISPGATSVSPRRPVGSSSYSCCFFLRLHEGGLLELSNLIS